MAIHQEQLASYLYLLRHLYVDIVLGSSTSDRLAVIAIPRQQTCLAVNEACDTFSFSRSDIPSISALWTAIEYVFSIGSTLENLPVYHVTISPGA